jgi:hypothetical protein
LFVESSGPVESSLAQNKINVVFVCIKKKIILPGVVFRPFFLFCVLVCVPVLLHFFPACCSIVCCFLTRPVLLMSLRSLPSETMVLFGVLLAVFPVGCEGIVIGVFVFGAYSLLLCLWIMLVTLFLVSFPVSELVSLFQFAVCCAVLSVCSFPLVWS